MKNSICLGIGLMGLLSFSPLGQAASLISSRFLPGDEVVSGAASDQTTPVIAAGGNTILAVWSDKRSSPATSPFYEFETSHAIYGVRLDASGNPIDGVSNIAEASTQ